MKCTVEQRQNWIDAARGLAILLVIVGHADGWLQAAPNVESDIRGIIYSFHMPLFFILSGLSLNLEQGWKAQVSKSLRRLLLPALIVFAIRMAGKLYYWPSDDFSYGAVKILLGAILGLGAGLQFAQFQLPMIGMCWFLVVLFFARLMALLGAQRISSRYHWMMILALMSFGMYLGAYHLVPVSIDLVFVATAFIWIGLLIKPILTGGGE